MSRPNILSEDSAHSEQMIRILASEAVEGDNASYQVLRDALEEDGRTHELRQLDSDDVQEAFATIFKLAGWNVYRENRTARERVWAENDAGVSYSLNDEGGFGLFLKNSSGPYVSVTLGKYGELEEISSSLFTMIPSNDGQLIHVVDVGPQEMIFDLDAVLTVDNVTIPEWVEWQTDDPDDPFFRPQISEDDLEEAKTIQKIIKGAVADAHEIIDKFERGLNKVIVSM